MKKHLKILVVGLILALFSVNGFAGETETSEGETDWKNGILTFSSDDGQFETFFDVRMFINGALFYNSKNKFSNGTHLRKARFAMKTKLWGVWRAEWDMDIAEGTVEVKDMFLSYCGFYKSHIKLGHFKMPLGLNELTTSRYQTFVERAYPSLAFEVDRHTGIEYSIWRNKWNLRAAAYGQPMNDDKNKTDDETGIGLAARFVFAPIKTENTVLHLGIASVYQKPDDETNIVEVQSEPECKITDQEILSVNVNGVDNFTKIGLEGALAFMNFNVQSEYIRMDINRSGTHKETDPTDPDNQIDVLNKNVTFDGGYVFASWVITGEKRPWDASQGEFGQIVPASNKLGAWEIAVRYSHLNLSDVNAQAVGGMANNITVGLNWYANPNVRFMLNYTIVDNSEGATGAKPLRKGNDDFSILHGMMMVYF